MPRSPSAPSRVQRRQSAPRRAPQPTGLGAAATGAAAGGALGGATGAVPALAVARGATVPVETLLDALEEFSRRVRLHVGRTVGRATEGKLPAQEIADLIALETEYGEEFERKARERVRTAWAKIQGLPEGERLPAIRALLEQERRYAGQRAEASAVRGIRTVERVAVKRESPLGAYWKLGVAENHTRDCVAMAGKIWPWDVLDTDHPPLGPGCVCELVSIPVAVLRGLAPAGAKPIEDARRKREMIKTLYGVHGGLSGIREAEEIRKALVGTGLATEEEALQALGRWLKGDKK